MQSRCTTRKGTFVTSSRWKAAPKCKQQLGRPLNANLPPEQGPYEIGFFAQKAQPGLAVSSESQIGLLIVTFGNLQLFISNRHCCFHFIVTGEREVIDSVKAFRLTFLKNEVQASQERANGSLAGQAVRHTLGLFVGKAPRYELFGIRIGNNVDRLRFVLQGPNDIVQKLLAVGEEGRDYVLTRRAYRHAISGLVVGAERHALPHGDRLR